MANLQQIIKVTKEQYETLKNGGTVGGYTGLDENNLYLVQTDGQADVDLSNYVDLTSDQDITGKKTFKENIEFEAVHGIQSIGGYSKIGFNDGGEPCIVSEHRALTIGTNELDGDYRSYYFPEGGGTVVVTDGNKYINDV